MVPKLSPQKFIGTNNLDAFFLEIRKKHKIELNSGDFSESIFNHLREHPNLLKIIFIFDNLNKKIWLWYSKQNKILKQKLKFLKLKGDKRIVNKILTNKNNKKTSKIVIKFLNQKLNASFDDYITERVSGIEESKGFEDLFQYEVVDVNLYKIHYKKSEYANIYDNDDKNREEIQLKKCGKCGWIMKGNRNFCPKCKTKYV